MNSLQQPPTILDEIAKVKEKLRDLSFRTSSISVLTDTLHRVESLTSKLQKLHEVHWESVFSTSLIEKLQKLIEETLNHYSTR